VVAGVLLGVVVLATLVGLHTGPHAHVVAAAVGVFAAAWLAYMAVDLSAHGLVLSLLAADVVVSGGVGFAGWKALTSVDHRHSERSLHNLEGKMGVAVGPLDPSGIVRVRGESWSATSLNGPIDGGTPVQVISIEGVRLNVWGEATAGLGNGSVANQQHDLDAGSAGGENAERPARGADTGGFES
jgi:membrane-bound ClpP family serine protease